MQHKLITQAHVSVPPASDEGDRAIITRCPQVLSGETISLSITGGCLSLLGCESDVWVGDSEKQLSLSFMVPSATDKGTKRP